MKDRLDAILLRSQAEYLDSLISERDPLLAEMEQYAHEHHHPIADPEVAQLLRILVRLKKPRRLIEVGTNIGYSVVVMGRECDPEAVIETIEIDPEIRTTARKFVERAKLRCRVEFHLGAALEVLDLGVRASGPPGEASRLAIAPSVTPGAAGETPALLRLEGTFDFAFIDCVKTEYQQYVDLLLPRLEAGAVMVFDNLLWKGEVADGKRSAEADALRKLNAGLVSDPRLLSTILPVSDGVGISMVQK